MTDNRQRLIIAVDRDIATKEALQLKAAMESQLPDYRVFVVNGMRDSVILPPERTDGP